MNGRKYVVVIILVWLTMLTWGLYLVFEGSRMVRAEDNHVEDLIRRGMETYAENCVVCHGANGQGHVGPALNKEEWRGDPEEKKDIFELIVSTVRDGRPGTIAPRWEQVVTGEWASYTAMPTFGSVNGGPFNELYLRALASFIMMGDFRQVSSLIPDPNIPDDREEALGRMANAATLSPEENRRGKELFLDKGCAACHSISGIGGSTGPDLSEVGGWTTLTPVDEWEDFLYTWVEFPPNVVNRAPVYWSNYSGPLPFAVGADTSGGGAAMQRQTGQGILDIGGDAGAIDRDLLTTLPLPTRQELGATQMPPMPMTDEERADLVKYLARLGR